MKITSAQYQQARKAIAEKAGVSPSNYAFRHALGISLRQAQRYESGETAVPPIVARLLYMFHRFGVPAELAGQFVGRGTASRRAKGAGGSPVSKGSKQRMGGLPRGLLQRSMVARRAKEKASVA